jgi:hypothetical protein
MKRLRYSARRDAIDTRRSELRTFHGYARFGQMTWPHWREEWDEVMHRVRYGEPSKTDLYAVLAVAESYFALIAKPAPMRDAIVARVREAVEMSADAGKKGAK